MIIPALVRLYDHLIEEGDETLAPKGYSRQQVSFKVVLNKDGSLHEFQEVAVDVPREVRKKVKGQTITETKIDRRPAQLLVPGQAKPSGSGINPCFLWDNAAYMLGFKADDPKPERTKEAFKAFRDKHLALKDDIKDPAFKAVCAFLESWRPSDARSHKHLADIATNFGVFQVRAQQGYVHERAAVKEWWKANGADDEPGDEDDAAPASRGGSKSGSKAEPTSLHGPSLATGASAPLARLHKPMIKGVLGAQSSGAAIVSFNQTAFNSYAKEQGANAPVSVDEAFKYCTALNQLTTDNRRRVRIAGDTYVFWSETPSKAEDYLAWSLDEAAAATDDDARHAFERFAHGLDAPALGDPKTPFYILGLSPNISRLSVRVWLVSTVGEIAARLRQHHADLALEPRPTDAAGNDPPPMSTRRLVGETAAPKGGFADGDRVSPLLAAAVTRAILTGAPYPRALLAGVLARCRIEGLADSQSRNDWKHAQHRRCAIIRACLMRDARHTEVTPEIPVSLDQTRDDPPYLLGRLFAVLERTQENALGRNLNTTIKDRYYGAASSTPAAVFPRLLRLTQHHLNKVEHPGQKTLRDKEVGRIVDRLTNFPPTLGLEGQGLFAIGYYHQRQSYFAKSTPDGDPETTVG